MEMKYNKENLLKILKVMLEIENVISFSYNVLAFYRKIKFE